MPNARRVREYYAAYYRNSTTAVTCHSPPHFAGHLAGIGRQHLQGKSIDILDYGGGDGSIARALSGLLTLRYRSTTHVTIVDLHHETAGDDATVVPLEWHETLAEVEGRRFDLVLASAILEHLPHPQEDLWRLLSSLRPSGILYARTPSVAIVLRILAKLGISYDFTYPAHLHDLGQDFWERVLDRIPASVGNFHLLRSCPSLVETGFRVNPVRTLAAHSSKSIWRLAGRMWPLVGGWEVLIERRS